MNIQCANARENLTGTIRSSMSCGSPNTSRVLQTRLVPCARCFKQALAREGLEIRKILDLNRKKRPKTRPSMCRRCVIYLSGKTFLLLSYANAKRSVEYHHTLNYTAPHTLVCCNPYTPSSPSWILNYTRPARRRQYIVITIVMKFTPTIPIIWIIIRKWCDGIIIGVSGNSGQFYHYI